MMQLLKIVQKYQYLRILDPSLPRDQILLKPVKTIKFDVFLVVSLPFQNQIYFLLNY